MEAAVWTLIALLAGGQLGTIFYLGTKIDAQRAELGARIDALSARIDVQTARIDDHLGRHAG